MAGPAPEWEVSKENYQPLRAGRAGKGLATPKKEVPRAVLADTEERRRTFEQELAEYAGDDPLEVWMRYIRWVQQAYRSGGEKAQLLQLLERCTRELEAFPRYRSDHRYLRLWIRYADSVPEPQDVFTYLRDKCIGQDQALYYTAYATFLEMRGAHTRAREVYADGLARYAAPLDQLRQKSQEFEARMVKREERRARGEVAPADAETVARNTFGELPTKGRARARGGTAARPPRGGLSATRPAQPNDAESAAAPSNAGGDLAIFTDPEFGGAENGPAYLAPRSTLERLPAYDAGRKENAMAAAPWAGAQLPQRRGAAAAVAAPAPALEIPVDEELAATQPLPLDPAQKPLRRRLDGEADLQRTLEQDPLQLRRAQAPSAAAAPPPPTQQQQQQQPRRREARETVYAYDAAALHQASSSAGGGGAEAQELCFEELRARHMRREHAAVAAGSSDSQAAAAHPTPEVPPRPQQQPSPPETRPAAAEQEAAAPSALTLAPPAPATLVAALVPKVDVQDAAAAAVDVPDSAAAAADPQPAVLLPVPAATSATGSHDKPAASGSGLQQERPTAQPAETPGVLQQLPAVSVAQPPGQQPPAAGVISAADADNAARVPASRSPLAKRKRVCGLVARPTPQQSPGPQQPDAIAAAMSPVLVSSFADAAASSPSGAAGGLDDMDDIFAGAFSGPVLDQASSAAALEPTLTMNTRTAWDAINGMFSAALPHEAAEANAATATGASAAAPRPPLPRRASIGTGPSRRRSIGGDAAATASLAAARARRRSSILPSAFTQPICIREDTEYLSFGDGAALPASRADTSLRGSGGDGGSGNAGQAAAAAPGADETGPLPMYEDTQFLTGPSVGGSRQPSGELGARGGNGGGSGGGGDDTTGLLVREDTCFLPDAPVAAASAALEQTGGLQLYEDTGFLTENVPQPAGPQAVSSHPASPAAPALEQTSGLQLYEDTVFLSENVGPRPAGPQAVSSQPAPAPAPALEQTGGLQLYEDTVLLSENVGPRPAGPQAVSSQPASAPAPALEQTGGLQLYEDTGFLAENVPPRGVRALASLVPHLPAAAAEQPSSSQQEFDGEAENQPPLGGALQPLVGMPNGHAAKPPLQALSDQEAAARGISIGSGVPSDAELDEHRAAMPAAVLAQAGSTEQDDFEVFRDV